MAEPAAIALLRHTIATLAYRANKTVRDAPDDFATARPSPTSRTAGEILAHMGDLMDWAVALVDGEHAWDPQPPRPWDDDVRRFFDGLAAFDLAVARGDTATPAEALFQGPIADALTHGGQIALMRRVAGSPVRGENYLQADIAAGRTGTEQAAPRREFD